jgi:NAD(P)-dependent dehydrogenase (short-subunit alcohol dehydrogenase family)
MEADPDSPLFNIQDGLVLITGAARRIGRVLALAAASAGAGVVIHYNASADEAEQTAAEIKSLGKEAFLIKADLADPDQAASIVPQAARFGRLAALVNNASIFEPITLAQTSYSAWQRHLAVNLTAPFLLSQSFGACLAAGEKGRIINLLDWRALRPGADHFPYTISKAALASMTRSLAVALAPHIVVNGLALGAILPPSHGSPNPDLLKTVPANRWAGLDELSAAFVFLLTGPDYITGEILHLDGGRHLV